MRENNITRTTPPLNSLSPAGFDSRFARDFHSSDKQNMLQLQRLRQMFDVKLFELTRNNEQLLLQLQMQKQDILRELELRTVEHQRTNSQLNELKLDHQHKLRLLHSLQEELLHAQHERDSDRIHAHQQLAKLQDDFNIKLGSLQRQLQSESHSQLRQKQVLRLELQGLRKKLVLQREQAEERLTMQMRKFQRLEETLRERTCSLAQQLAEAQASYQTSQQQSKYLREQVARTSAQVQLEREDCRKLSQQSQSLYQKCLELEELLSKSQLFNKQNMLKFRAMDNQISAFKDLLLQSSHQLQRCRDQLAAMEDQKLSLLEDSKRQQTRLILVLEQKEVQCQRWRDSYLNLKSQL